MPFGISPAGEIFQQRLDQAIDDLDGVRTVADDILIIENGETMQEAVADHDRKLKELFDRCRAKHIKLNPNKIELKKTSMPYIGNILTSDGGNKEIDHRTASPQVLRVDQTPDNTV